jgi:hypothetical protein
MTSACEGDHGAEHDLDFYRPSSSDHGGFQILCFTPTLHCNVLFCTATSVILESVVGELESINE